MCAQAGGFIRRNGVTQNVHQLRTVVVTPAVAGKGNTPKKWTGKENKRLTVAKLTENGCKNLKRALQPTVDVDHIRQFLVVLYRH